MRGLPISDAPSSSRLTLWPLPDQRHLYMLVAGVVLGVLLGPAVLGRAAPQLYDPLFLGSGDMAELNDAQAALDDFNSNPEERQKRIDNVIAQFEFFSEDDQSMKIAMDEQLVKISNEFANIEADLKANVKLARVPMLTNQDAHRKKLSGMATMMLLLIVVILAAEAILGPTRDELESGKAALPPMLSRLITIRYGLATGWLMLMLAQPVWLRGIDFVFGGLLLAVVLIAGLMPLGKKA
ncbi:MAG: hypothetical protein AAF085_00895 [Planctomycetota bacterium]